MSELSQGVELPLRNGPESCHVVDAIDALLREDVTAARAALIAGAEECGWPAVAHRLDVAGRALALDAGMRSGGDDTIVVLPDLDTTGWLRPAAQDAPTILDRWASSDLEGELPADLVWSSLALVAWLVDRAGYPAQVIV